MYCRLCRGGGTDIVVVDLRVLAVVFFVLSVSAAVFSFGRRAVLFIGCCCRVEASQVTPLE